MNEKNLLKKVINFYNSDKIELEKRILYASKKNNNNYGYIDVFITNLKYPDICLIFELKNDKKKLKKGFREAKHYCEYIENYKYKIPIAIAGSDNKFDVLIEIMDEIHTNLLTFDEIYDIIKTKTKKHMSDKLKNVTKNLHNYMRDNIKLTEEQKPMLISGIMMALMNKLFYKTYEEFGLLDRVDNEKNKLPEFMLNSIDDMLKEENISKYKRSMIMHSLAFIKSIKRLNEPHDEKRTRLMYLIDTIKFNIIDRELFGEDILGMFYGEFIKYSAGDGKGLGVVLTPKHISYLMIKLLNLKKSDKIYDPCCGTGRFLITAMDELLKKATKEIERNNIKKNQLYGVENLGTLFTMCSANMLFHGDGKSNIKLGSCFDFEEEMKQKEIDVSISNPPYSQKTDGEKEFDFIMHQCRVVKEGGKVISIIPTSILLKDTEYKEKLMLNNTVEAVIKVNDKTFHPVSVGTSIILITPGVKHPQNKKIFFASFVDDGCEDKKNVGHIPTKSTYEIIDDIVAKFNNMENSDISMTKTANPKDEWDFDSLIGLNYNKLNSKDFLNYVIEYYAIKYKLLDNYRPPLINREFDMDILKEGEYESFRIKDLFEFDAKSVPASLKETDGDVPVLGAKKINNAIIKFVEDKYKKLKKPPFSISINLRGNGGAGLCFLQPKEYYTTATVGVLLFKTEYDEFGKLIISYILSLLKYKFNFTRGITWDRIKDIELKIPTKKYIDSIRKSILL